MANKKKSGGKSNSRSKGNGKNKSMSYNQPSKKKKTVSLEKAFKAEVTRLTKTYGFVKNIDENSADFGSESFVFGRALEGALQGDIVYAETVTSFKTDRPEAKILQIIEHNPNAETTGVIEKAGGVLYFRPDSWTKEYLVISENDFPIKDGDKVLARILKRGAKHSDHKVRITAVFGDSELAESSAKAILLLNGIETEFTLAAIDEAKAAEENGIDKQEYNKRLDLRNELIFTIDGADTKDIDDAISLTKTEKGWELGVHIADVSYYVKPKSELDNAAFDRGTSVYYANKVVPMLPKELSNGICSLNPNEDRLAFSCIMNLDYEGKIMSSKFSKTVIRSRVKGVYDEVNEILAALHNNEKIPAELAEKYDGLTDMMLNMDKLADILIENRKKRGAPDIDNPETKLVIENGVCIDVKAKERGKSEMIIEEFMIAANISAAKTAKDKEIPFVFRVHEDPSVEKVTQLVDLLARLNVPVPKFTTIKAKHFADIINSVSENGDIAKYALAVKNMTLRTMAKARYHDEPLGHFGLVLDDYAHFTSPIRRYPDLAIHRILTDLCYDKKPADKISNRYKAFAKEASLQSSERELAAMRTERECTDCYVAEYMKTRLGEDFDGVITTVIENGFFVKLPNTVEGFVRTDSLPEPPYDFDGYFSVTKAGKPVYTIGDSVKVTCVAVNVSSGMVDFNVNP